MAGACLFSALRSTASERQMEKPGQPFTIYLSPLSQQNQYAGTTAHKSQLKITLDASRYVIFLSQLARKNSNLLLHENQLSVRAVRLNVETECNELTILSDIRLC